MKNISILISMMFLFSCVKSEDTKVTSGRTTVTKKEYTACTNNGTESMSANYLFFSNGEMKILLMYYDDLNCLNSSAKEINIFTGEYRYNAATSKMTDRTYKLEIAYLTTTEVSNRNTLNDCGYSDWAINVFKNATDNDDCIGGTVSSTSPEFEYDAILNELVFDDGNTIHNRVP